MSPRALTFFQSLLISWLSYVDFKKYKLALETKLFQISHFWPNKKGQIPKISDILE
jgi:hypothetical protein